MRTEGLIDLENRKGKQAGAFCTSMPDEGRVAIFCNSTGDEGDVGTLVHEMGHAFQAWESQKIEAVDLQWPTSDGAEIHSMGMEFLSLPHLSWFFNPDEAKKFSRHHIYDVVMLMCYICVVDEFQHRVYEHPEATPEHRDRAWNAIWDKYIPGLDFSGMEEYKYARWYAQGHIFESPFYYIDYAIAQTAAMQLGMMDQQDHDKALIIELYRWYEQQILAIGAVREELITRNLPWRDINEWFTKAFDNALAETRKKFGLSESWEPKA